jgi:hypothetical protein
MSINYPCLGDDSDTGKALSPIRIVIKLEGGLVEAIHADTDLPIQIAITDHDVFGAQREEILKLKDGTEFAGRIEHRALVAPDHVDEVFNVIVAGYQEDLEEE